MTVQVPSASRSTRATRHADRDACHRPRERIGQRLHAVAKGEAACGVRRRSRGPPAFPRALELALDQAAVSLLERVEARECGGHGDPLGVARIDTRDERVDRVVEKLGPEPAPDERGDRLLDVGWRGWNEGLAPEAELGAERERRGGKEGGGRGRQCDELAFAHDVSRGGDGGRVDPLVADAERFEELVDLRCRIERAVRTRLVKRAVAMQRADDTAGAMVAVENFDRRTAPLQLEGGDEPGDAGADDHGVEIGLPGDSSACGVADAVRAACGR